MRCFFRKVSYHFIGLTPILFLKKHASTLNRFIECHFWGQNTTSMSATENVLIGKFLMTWMFEMTTYLSLAAWKGRKQFGLLFFKTCLRELKGNRKSGVKHTLEIMVLFANMTGKKNWNTKAQIPLLLANQIEV